MSDWISVVEQVREAQRQQNRESRPLPRRPNHRLRARLYRHAYLLCPS